MTRRVTLPAPWAALAAAYGGVGALAEACGVSLRTIERWAHGQAQPSDLVRRAVDTMARRRGLAAPFAG